MRTLLPLIALLLTTSAAAESQHPVQALDQSLAQADLHATSPQESPAFDSSPELRPDGHSSCRDRIHQVREELGLPRLERDAAAYHEPLMIAAVDRRIDGCSVMVMHYDTRDARPVPMPESPARLERVPGG